MTRFWTFRSDKGYFGLDYNVNYFSSYNYTVYAPDNDAMAKARELGLPTWDELETIYNNTSDLDDEDPAKIAAKAEILAKAEAINDFIRYHFQNNSVYVDNTIEGGEFATACSDTLGIAFKVNVGGGSRQFTVTDAANRTITISDGDKLHNKMTRDYVFSKDPTDSRNLTTNSITTSSFAVVHEIDQPLCPYANGRYDGKWATAKARQGLVAHRKFFLERQKDMYRK